MEEFSDEKERLRHQYDDVTHEVGLDDEFEAANSAKRKPREMP